MSPIPMPPGYQDTKPLLSEEARESIRVSFDGMQSSVGAFFHVNREVLKKLLDDAKGGGRL